MGSAVSKPPEQVANDVVADAIRDHAIVVFSKRTCGYCDAVKHVLKMETRQALSRDECVVPNVKVIELDEGTAHVQRALFERTGYRTVPQVFIDRAFVGGADDTARLSRLGALRLALMRAARCPLPPLSSSSSSSVDPASGSVKATAPNGGRGELS